MIKSPKQMFVFRHVGEKTLKNQYIPPRDFDRIIRNVQSDYRPLYILAAETGFRIDDVLKIRQWQAKGSVLTLREEKTGKERSVLLSDRAREAIKQQLATCGAVSPLRYLFPARTKRAAQKRRKLHRSTAHRHFSEAVKNAGFADCGYTVHSLRKIYARNLYKKTGSALAVQRDLNHDNLNTTLLYIADIQL